MNNNIPYEIKLLRRQAGEKSVQAFAELYFPHYLSKKSGSFHKELYGLLEQVSRKRGQNVAVAAPRDSAKSSIVSLIYVIWCICYKKENYIVVLSDTSRQAIGILANVKSELEGNKYLLEDFPEACKTDKDLAPFIWKQDQIITRNNIMISALGAEQKIRGRRNKEFRPSLIILDDIENDANVQSQERREKLYGWFTNAVLKAGTEKTSIIVIGTILHFDSLLAKLTRDTEMHNWIKKIYCSVIKDSSETELWAGWSRILNYHETYKDKEGREAADLFFQENKEKMLKGTEVLWPEKEDYYALMLMRDYEEASFEQEKQNNPINPKERRFNMDVAYYWEDEYKSEEELLKAIGEDLELYGACDPSLGLRGKKGDFSAIITLARNSKTNTFYVLEADIKKRTLDELYEAITECCMDRQYDRFVIEANNFQRAVVEDVNTRLEERSSDFRVEPVIHSSDKEGRIGLLSSPIEKGRIKFSRKHGELLKQLKYFPKGSHDDGPDALEMAYRVNNGKMKKEKIGWIDMNGNDPTGVKEIYKDPNQREGTMVVTNEDEDD